jgi:ABC-2 type transport system ATP-binding protein
MSASEPAVVLNGVTKKYGEFTAVSEVDLVVPRGSIYGFLGPNGAGKTTTIRMILDIVKPTQGRIAVLGADSALKVRDRIGYLPEEKGLYKKMKSWAIIAYFAQLKGLDAKTAKTRAFALLEKYGLKDFANARCETLSKGMGQKVQVLASIAHEPEFVILDEPFSGLDPANQQVMESVVRDMHARGTTVIFSTHVMSHAERMCDRILLIAKARKIFDGTIPEAKKLIPRRVRVGGQTAETLQRLPGVVGVIALAAADEAPRWDLTLADGADPHELLRRCFRDGLELTSFELYEPTLHDVFLQLVGEGAKVASFR